MNSDALEFPIDYEPRLVEAAVLAALRGRRGEAEFRAERDAVYEVADPEDREARFRRLDAAWFERVGLGDAVGAAIREQPAVSAGTSRCLVVLAPSRREEGADLLVAADAGPEATPRRTLFLQLRAETLADPERLRSLLRRELLHVADMLDPAFGYAPEAFAAAARQMPLSLLRARYHVLWAVAVNGRLVRRGWAPAGIRAERFREFARTFPMLGKRTEAAFVRFFDERGITHAELVAFAAEPGCAAGPGRGGPHPGERCPLCGCPTYAFEPDPERLPDAVRERIRRSAPMWQPADGLCRQCADLHRAAARAMPTGRGAA